MNTPRNVEAWERILSVAVGAAVGAYAVRGRRPTLAVAGAALIARGALGYCPINQFVGRNSNLDDTREALGGSRGIKLEESVTIRSSADVLYNKWHGLTQLPSFMPHIERVDTLGNGKSHWVMRGPAGMHFEWDAEIINDIRPDLVAWKSLPGADVVSAGSVKFRERQRRGGVVTEVTVTLQYEPIGGKAAAVLSWFAGQSPASMLREDLRRFKALIEAHEAPTKTARSTGSRSLVAKISGVDA